MPLATWWQNSMSYNLSLRSLCKLTHCVLDCPLFVRLHPEIMSIWPVRFDTLTDIVAIHLRQYWWLKDARIRKKAETRLAANTIDQAAAAQWMNGQGQSLNGGVWQLFIYFCPGLITIQSFLQNVRIRVICQKGWHVFNSYKSLWTTIIPYVIR